MRTYVVQIAKKSSKGQEKGQDFQRNYRSLDTYVRMIRFGQDLELPELKLGFPGKSLNGSMVNRYDDFPY